MPLVPLRLPELAFLSEKMVSENGARFWGGYTLVHINWNFEKPTTILIMGQGVNVET